MWWCPIQALLTQGLVSGLSSTYGFTRALPHAHSFGDDASSLVSAQRNLHKGRSYTCYEDARLSIQRQSHRYPQTSQAHTHHVSDDMEVEWFMKSLA